MPRPYDCDGRHRPQSGAIRFTFGLTALQTGIDVVVVIIGVYGLGEVFQNMETIKSEVAIKIQSKFGRIWVTMDEFKRCLPAILRETPIGFFVPEPPRSGRTIAALMAYKQRKAVVEGARESSAREKS